MVNITFNGEIFLEASLKSGTKMKVLGVTISIQNSFGECREMWPSE